jgi:hypothetical protein
MIVNRDHSAVGCGTPIAGKEAHFVAPYWFGHLGPGHLSREMRNKINSLAVRLHDAFSLRPKE